jgi:hypothetical protein
MATADAIEGSSSVEWGKGVATIYGSRYKTHGNLPRFDHPKVKIYVLLV